LFCYYGQTNGIPQGSVLMDFIAEMVLGYIDERLSQCLDKKMDYRIIRYRDDYRIFTNSKTYALLISPISLCKFLSMNCPRNRMRINCTITINYISMKNIIIDENMNYHIIRYRDDYRIFTNNKKEGNTVIRELSKILSEMGMRLNGEKTYHSNDIVNE
jgi:hypothetical protein